MILSHVTTLALALLPQTALSSARRSVEPDARTRVLVLATPHLDRIEGFEREMLEPLLDRLEAFAPDAICVENLPGRSIETMLAFAPVYDDVLAGFASEALRWGSVVQEELELDAAGARRRLPELFASLQAVADDTARADALLDVCLHLLAAYESASAALSWQQLAADARKGALLPDGVASFLSSWSMRRGEVSSVALPLAVRLGHDRVHAVDDHADKDDYLAFIAELSAELEASPELASAQGAAVFREMVALQQQGVAEGDVLPLYRFLNSEEYGRRDIEAQWDVFLRTRLASGNDRRRLALWDVRNLNIASNVRRVSARHPGGRVLVVIGASHKSFLDALLATALDVEVVDATEVLAPEVIEAGDAHPR